MVHISMFRSSNVALVTLNIGTKIICLYEAKRNSLWSICHSGGKYFSYGTSFSYQGCKISIRIFQPFLIYNYN